MSAELRVDFVLHLSTGVTPSSVVWCLEVVDWRCSALYSAAILYPITSVCVVFCGSQCALKSAYTYRIPPNERQLFWTDLFVL